MESEILTLTYLNEDDKAYGLAGMTISLAALDAMDRIASVSLDAQDEPMITFSNEYYFSISPNMSPKSAWDTLINNFYLTAAMAIGNVASRSMVRLKQRDVPADVMQKLYEVISEEGKDSCSLEDDEIEAIYNKTRRHTQRIFGNPRVHTAVDEFVRTLSRKRRLTGGEIEDELRLLQLL